MKTTLKIMKRKTLKITHLISKNIILLLAMTKEIVKTVTAKRKMQARTD